MGTRHDIVRYELLRPGQIRMIRDNSPIVYLPVGSLHWHGLHNPLGTDGLKAHAICCEAALRHGGVVLPAIYFGVIQSLDCGPDGWQEVSLGSEDPGIFTARVMSIVQSLVQAQWKIIVGVTGHDSVEQQEAMQRAIELATTDRDAAGFAVMEGELHTPSDDIPFIMDHGGTWDTSCMMYLQPDKVNLDPLRHQAASTESIMEQSGPEGISGPNPLKYASAAMGQKIIERMGNQIGQKSLALLLEHEENTGGLGRMADAI